MKLVEGGVTAQAKQAFANLGYILEEAGSSYDKVIKTVLLLDDINDFAPINEIYKEGTLRFDNLFAILLNVTINLQYSKQIIRHVVLFKLVNYL